jgi:cobalt/nickel transport system permease protein
MTRTRIVTLTGLLLALVLAGVVSYYASASPDGLDRVATDKGFDKGEKAHPLEESPVSGYSLRGVDDERVSGGLAGVAGVGVTFLAGGALALVLRRRNQDREGDGVHSDPGAAGGSG